MMIVIRVVSIRNDVIQSILVPQYIVLMISLYLILKKRLFALFQDGRVDSRPSG